MEKNIDKIFELPGIGADEEAINQEILARIKEKEKKGIYDLYNIEKEARIDFLDIKNDAEFLDYYLKIIKKSWAIDINDFEIPRKKGHIGWAEVQLKKVIWKLLKFYTYRIFSQQIEFNSQVKNTLNAIERDFSEKVRNLEIKIEQLKIKNEKS